EAISQIPFKLMRIGLMMGESGFSHLCTLMKTPVFAGKKSATALPSGALRTLARRCLATDMSPRWGFEDAGAAMLCYRYVAPLGL
ncbi:MAG: hypothetical protein ACK5E3_12305, partial [Planctomycetota bacterium]